MSTRFYLQYNEAAPVSPSFGVGSPEFDWSSSSGAVRCKASPSKKTGDTPTTQGPSLVSNNTNLLYVQGVTDALPTGTAFTTSTLVKAQFQVSESATDDNIFPNLHLKVVSNDGATLRQELRTATDTTGVEFGTTLTNRAFALSDALVSGYTTVSGDRLVIGVGAASTAGVSPSASIRFGSDGTDLAGSGSETGTTFVGWVEFTNLDIFPSGIGVSATGASRKLSVGGPVNIGFDMDDRPVPIFDWQIENSTDHGDRTLTGRFPREFHWPEQGTPVVAWRGPGNALFSGELVTDPKLEDGAWSFRAEGFTRKLEQNRTRRFFRSDGFADWSDKEGDPFNGTNNDKWELSLEPGLAKWRQGTADGFSTNDQAGFEVWKDGALITRYEFEANTGGSYGAFDLQTQRATELGGSNTTITNHALTASMPATFSQTLGTPENALILRIIANTNAASGTRRVVTARKMKVYGLTNDDTFSASDVVLNVAGLVGLATDNVTTNLLPVLPLDWTEDLAGLLTYMAELTDWRWMARHDGITFGPWGRIWEGSTIAGVTPSWEPAERANVFVQPYLRLNGNLTEATATADPNPFPGEERSVYGDVLADRQTNGDLALAIATERVAWEASHRIDGQAALERVFFRGSQRSPYEVDAGDQILITDLAPALGVQRITAVTYKPDEDVTIQVGDEFNTTALLKELDEDRPRRSRAAKKKKRTKPPGMP